MLATLVARRLAVSFVLTFSALVVLHHALG